MYCTSCGIKNAADSNFCKQCGGKIDRAAATKINEDEFERAMPEDEQVSALLERAYRLRKEANLDGAIALCQEILRLRKEHDLDSTSAHSLLGQLYEQQGDHEAAIRELERVLQINPGSIADRVKLDELRGQTEYGSETKSHPRVVMAAPQSPPGLGYARFTSAGVAVALLVLGGLVALQFRPRSADNVASTSNSASSRMSPEIAAKTTPTVPDNGVGTGVSTALSGTPGDKPAEKADGTVVSTPGTVGPVNPAGNTVANNLPGASKSVSNPASPVVIYQTPQIRYVQVPASPAANPASATSSVHLPGIKPPKTGAANKNGGSSSAVGTSGGHILLQGDSDVTENKDGHIIVPVNPDDVPRKKNEGGVEGNGFSRVVVDKNPSGDLRTAPAPGPTTTTESRSFLAVGDEKKRQRDYKGAIDAFTKSLASAGDQTGYVLQQRALCFQQLNDLSSAKSDYEKAINEYRKLEARDPETARNGIRSCEKGIKTCGN